MEPALLAQSPAAREAALKRSEQNYARLRPEFQQKTQDPEIAWQFARACMDLSEFAKNDSELRTLAEEGINAARQSLRQKPDSAAAHYYLGLNLAQRARTEKIGALKDLHLIEEEFERSIELDPKFDHAGAYRSLGLLYREAPGWPLSIGNARKAREHLLKAVEFAPDFPENWLTLLESYLIWSEKERVATQLPALEAKLAAARQKFSGPEWKWSWDQWERTLAQIKKAAATTKLQSPRGGNR